jgi:hypothetical protein
VTLRRADQYQSRAYRGVQWHKLVSLYENDGTIVTVAQGDPLDLTDWPTLVLAAHPEGLEGSEFAIRGQATYETIDEAVLELRIARTELERAVVETPSGGAELRPIRVSVTAYNNAGDERPLLGGIIAFLPSGFTG